MLGAGEDMTLSDEMKHNDEDMNEDFLLVRRKREKAKEEILDETFKKAEFLKRVQPAQEKRRHSEKPFFKSGILVIIIAILALAVVNYIPWMYARYSADNVTVEQMFYKDFKNEETKNNETYQNASQKVTGLFDSPCTNCTNNSQNYIGLTTDDFKTIPKLTSYGFVALAIMGLIFTIFVVIDRFRNFSIETSYLVCSIFNVTYVAISVFTLLLSIKFLASHFLTYYNGPFIETSGLTDVNLVFLAPIMMIFISCAIMKGSMTVMKINFREVEKILEAEESGKEHLTYRYGGTKI